MKLASLKKSFEKKRYRNRYIRVNKNNNKKYNKNE